MLYWYYLYFILLQYLFEFSFVFFHVDFLRQFIKDYSSFVVELCSCHFSFYFCYFYNRAIAVSVYVCIFPQFEILTSYLSLSFNSLLFVSFYSCLLLCSLLSLCIILNYFLFHHLFPSLLLHFFYLPFCLIFLLFISFLYSLFTVLLHSAYSPVRNRRGWQ